MNQSNNKRMLELEQKREWHQKKVTECIDWLLNHFDHTDRAKIFNDKAYHECEVKRIKDKMLNFKNGIPENGYAMGIEENNLNRNIINKTQS